MSPEQKLARAAEIAEELTYLNRLPKEAAEMLDRELERLISFHTERCCDLKLAPLESALHREGRAVAKGLMGFFDKRRTALKEELLRLRR